MFGSSFETNFGIPTQPQQVMDPGSGILGPNTQSPAANLHPMGSPLAPPAAAPGLPGGGGPAATPPLGPSPLGAGALGPGAGPNPQQIAQQVPDQNQAPAAGIGSPFGKANV